MADQEKQTLIGTDAVPPTTTATTATTTSSSSTRSKGGFGCVGCVFLIVGCVLTGIGGSAFVQENSEMYAGENGSPGTCSISRNDGLAFGCVAGCTFYVEFAPLLYPNNVRWQHIPYGADGLDPAQMPPGHIQACYSVDFESDQVVLWKRTYHTPATIYYMVVGIVFLTLNVCVCFCCVCLVVVAVSKKKDDDNPSASA